MIELKIAIIGDLGASLPQRQIAKARVALAEIRQLKADGEKICLTQPLNPMGSLKMEMTFSAKENKLRRRNAVHEKIYIHNGHRYVPQYFNAPVFCAYCKVNVIIMKG